MSQGGKDYGRLAIPRKFSPEMRLDSWNVKDRTEHRDHLVQLLIAQMLRTAQTHKTSN